MKFMLYLHSFRFYIFKVNDIKVCSVNPTNGKAEVDVSSLLLLTSDTFSRDLTRSTNHKRRYMINGGFLKILRLSGKADH